MKSSVILSEINVALYSTTKPLAIWLQDKLSLISSDWWKEVVLQNITTFQRDFIVQNNIHQLDKLDLACLLRIGNKSWYMIKSRYYLSSYDQQIFHKMVEVRNLWAHCSVEIPPKDTVIDNVETILAFMDLLGIDHLEQQRLRQLKLSVEQNAFTEDFTTSTSLELREQPVNNSQGITIGSVVSLRSDTQQQGAVIGIKQLPHAMQYEVFIEGVKRPYFEEQLVLQKELTQLSWSAIGDLKALVTAQQIRNPSNQHLYSLNSARIDFVPYQFRPALKIINSDKPRILIADSVGVGKTIEAGLILRELEARNEQFESVLIICPKPLVVERKWELEMRRFDESFTQMDGVSLRQAISDTDRDGEWPDRHKKTIIPFSLLSEDLLYGNSRKKAIGLEQLNPPPHFDLVIIDEAHHIRNAETQAYQVAKHFCDNADAVVMLTATPIQTGEHDLYTLLNLLRPDIVLDSQTFRVMSAPNPYLNAAIQAIKFKRENWHIDAKEALFAAAQTQWGEVFLCPNPLYKSAIETLETPESTSREDVVTLLRDLESLHSFANMINRTRRQDIQDFCIRRAHTISVSFTPEQEDLHNALLEFEANALTLLHGSRSVLFMMTTLRRQAASCLFGLAPTMEHVLARRISQIIDDGELEADIRAWEDVPLDKNLQSQANHIINLAENLSENDPKFDGMLETIRAKQKSTNNKIIIFSSFRHTLSYLRQKLQDNGYRVDQIDGSVKDSERLNIRAYFEKNRAEPDALDILLFTEVGCEGLDYQFCDMMINYDLPWNPMRIEQRIGRIDRRGQQSDVVNIFNMITLGTVDADIYFRCLQRIGVFEQSIGECSAILGEVTSEIEKIATDTTLTEGERQYKLAKVADNEISSALEIQRLEKEQSQLFGFELSEYTTNQDIVNSENPWISPASEQHLIETYLQQRIGEGKYILGEKNQRSLRLSAQARGMLRDDFREMKVKPTELSKQWDRFLKGNQQVLPFTFDASVAEKDRNALFITPIHPLVRQAAINTLQQEPLYVGIIIDENETDMTSGTYGYLLQQWDYTGNKKHSRIVPIMERDMTSTLFFDLLESATTGANITEDFTSLWDDLDASAYARWTVERQKHVSVTEETCNYRQEAFENTYLRRKLNLQTLREEAHDENIIRMRKSQLSKLEKERQDLHLQLDAAMKRADIHTSTLVKGVIVVK